MKQSPAFQNSALLVLRIVIAVIFLFGAYAKLPLWSATPEATQMSSFMFYLMLFLSVAEPIGAIALLLGVLTCWASACLAIIMVGAAFVMQFQMGVGFVTAAGAGWNFPLMVFAGCVILMAFGAGQWSLEARRKS